MRQTKPARPWPSQGFAIFGTDLQTDVVRRINLLPEIVAALPSGERDRFESIYDVKRVEAELRLPAPMAEPVRRQFGDLEKILNQTVVSVTNRWTLEATSFNGLRALRPMPTRASRDTVQSETDPFRDPEAYTPDNVLGRVRGRRCATAANLAAADAWHAVVVFDEPDSLVFDADDVVDYLSTGLEWGRRAHAHDSTAVHPSLFWNANPRAGASIRHGHAQVIMRSDPPLARIETQRAAAERYWTECGKDYFHDLAATHASLGLLMAVGESSVAPHLTPIKEREVLVVGPELNEAFFETVGRTLVAFRDQFEVQAFNLAVFGPPITGPNLAGWERFPAVARLVDRGTAETRSSDFAGMELYGQSVVSSDPFEVAAVLGQAL